MEIGISTVCLPRIGWLPYLKMCNVDALEINPKTYLPYTREKLEKQADKIKDWHLGIHTHARPLFTKDEIFDNRSIAIIKSEVLAAKILSAGALIFHMPKKIGFSELDKEFDKLQEIINFAKDKEVQLYVENNPNHCWSDWKEIKQLLDTFPDLKFCLDIGHLRTASEKNKTNFNEFINELGVSSEYIHIHNSYGTKNFHFAINNGSIDILEVLNKLPNIKRIILEMPSFTDTFSSLKILRNWST